VVRSTAASTEVLRFDAVESGARPRLRQALDQMLANRHRERSASSGGSTMNRARPAGAHAAARLVGARSRRARSCARAAAIRAIANALLDESRRCEEVDLVRPSATAPLAVLCDARRREDQCASTVTTVVSARSRRCCRELRAEIEDGAPPSTPSAERSTAAGRAARRPARRADPRRGGGRLPSARAGCAPC
jgi:hypothetical protein